jgi:uncharacterized NAD(P)/FAD-binding protein YdhS
MLSHPPAGSPTVVVVGGGFSGLLTAIHLLARDAGLVVRLVEKAERFGLGRAYSAANGAHLLNVRAGNMSAFPDRPDHFTAWLARRGVTGEFVSRGTYGEYLQALLREALGADGHPGRLLLEQDEAAGLKLGGRRPAALLAVGRRLEADAVVLATGLGPPAAPAGLAPALEAPAYFPDPWAMDPDLVPAGQVLLVGSGLTMVDVALSLARPDRRLTAVSRRGLLPHTHGETVVAPMPDGDLSTPRRVLRRLRTHAAAVGWRSAVDSLRPLTPGIWRSWSLVERRRFLRHGRAWWEIHRHRMAPQVAGRIAELRAAGRLEVAAARLEGLAAADGGVAAALRGRGEATAQVRCFAAAVNCTGLSGALAGVPLLQRLVAQGWARSDPLGLGLDVDDAFRVIGAGGAPTPRLYAVGPPTRAARWESVAVPDLRSQTEALAVTLLSDLGRIGA